MADYKEHFIYANEIVIDRRPFSLEVTNDVKDLRVQMQRKLGLEINDPKIAVRRFVEHRYRPKGTQVALALTTGIVATDCNYAQDNAYPTGDSFEAFDILSERGSNFVWYEPQLYSGAYISLSTFELVIGIDKSKKFKDTYALLVEQRSKNLHQPTEISLPNQGMETRWTNKKIPIENIPLTTESFKQALKYDAATSLCLPEEEFIGYQDLGIAVIPGSILAGGVLVAEIDYKGLNNKYHGMQNEAKRNPDKSWKTPLMIKTSELSDFLRSSNVNPLLGESSLGSILRTQGFIDSDYLKALEHKI
jgi:hypothetical protein